MCLGKEHVMRHTRRRRLGRENPLTAREEMGSREEDEGYIEQISHLTAQYTVPALKSTVHSI
jgi:hypothetical protein